MSEIKEAPALVGYPKIETLFTRGDNFKVNTDQLRMPEFGLIKNWYVTEKIHGTNIRVNYDGERVRIAGRKSENTNDVPVDLYKYLLDTFTLAKLGEKFSSVVGADLSADQVTLFGEGCGPSIQKGGGNYFSTKSFVLFDVLVGKYWLEPDDIADIASTFGVQTPPVIGSALDLEFVVSFVRPGFDSIVALQNTGAKYQSEGIVARTTPGLMTRYGTRLMFKLKTEDFAITQ